jgi:TPR repeat protein
MLLAFVVAIPLTAIAGESELTRSLREQAVVLEHGEGVAKDPERAAKLYCHAARLGDPEAQYALGWMIANGRGFPRDDSLAAGLFRLSADQGHQHAERMMTLLKAVDARIPDCMHVAADGPAGGMTDSGGNDPSAGLPPEKQKIADLVRSLAPLYGVDPRLALALIRVESSFDPRALSPRNAQGLMQLIPETAKRFSVRNAFDPAENIRGGLTYLRWLLAYYRGRVELAAAAYNAGEGVVDRYRGVPPYKETQEYVRRIQTYFRAEQHPYDGRVVDPSPAFFKQSRSL